MKRITITLFLISLSSFLILLPSCVNFVAPEKKAAQSKDGRPMVNLNIGLSGAGDSSRALTDVLAKIGAERFEVAFFYNGPNGDGVGAQVYRTTWASSDRGSLWVEEADYGDGVNGAILFAGTERRVLLAIGSISAVRDHLGENQSGAVITRFSRAVTFELVPLTNDIYGHGNNDIPNPAESTFKLLPPFTVTTFGTETLYGNVYPVFELPRNETIQATYAIDFGGITTGIVTAGPPAFIPGFVGQIPYGIGLEGSFANIPRGDPPYGDPLPMHTLDVPNPWELTLRTKNIPGLLSVRIEIPVFAWSNARGYENVVPGRWIIQGGIDNAVLDRGVTQNATGGAFLIRIAEN
ncbi:MAG: hypothetical protein FWD36_04090 [Treponema sp.]|nr:hypothetical protein [Treponema sp.]